MATTIRELLSRELSRGKTLRQLAEQIGDVSHEALRLVANGTRQPSAKMARRICESLKISEQDTDDIIHQIQAVKHGLVSEECKDDKAVAMLLTVFFEHSGREQTPELVSFLSSTYRAILEKDRNGIQ